MKKIIFLFTFIVVLLLICSSKVNAFTIVLDPGHGGNEKDKGVGCVNGNLIEKEIVLEIGKNIKNILEQYEGVNVIMTRQEDKEISVYERAIIARNNNADLFVSLHINDAVDKSINGVEVWITREDCLPKYQKDTYVLAEKIVKNISNLGISKRNDTGIRICDGRSDSMDIYSTGKNADYYGVIAFAMRGTRLGGVVDENGNILGRNVTYLDENKNEITKFLELNEVDTYSANLQKGEGVPTILIEHAFIYADSDYLDSPEDLRKLAIADAKAIIEHYGLKLKNMNSSEAPKVEENKEPVIEQKEDESENNDKIDVKSKVLKIEKDKYKGLIDTNILGIVLENENDIITGNDLMNAFPNADIISPRSTSVTPKYILKSGDIVTIDGVKHTIIVYGDANGDSEVDIFDVVTILSSIINSKPLEGLSFISSDINKNGEIDIFTVVKIIQAICGRISYADLIK